MSKHQRVWCAAGRTPYDRQGASARLPAAPSDRRVARAGARPRCQGAPVRPPGRARPPARRPAKARPVRPLRRTLHSLTSTNV